MSELTLSPSGFERILSTVITISAFISVSTPLAHMLSKNKRATVLYATTAMIILGAFSIYEIIVVAKGGYYRLYDSLMVIDGFAAMMSFIAWLVGMIVFLASILKSSEWPSFPALQSLIPLVVLGSFLLASTTDLVLLIVLWILVSVTSYVIIALPKDKISADSAIKYGIMGGVATAFLVIWLGLHLASSGSLSLDMYSVHSLIPLAVLLLMVAIGFKTGVVPFHWWLPDVYGLSNGYAVSVVVGPIKVGILAFLARALYNVLEPSIQTAYLLSFLAAITMTYGNIAAFTTRDLQRMMAYSSIAHIGYILTPLAVLALPDAPRELAIASIAVHVFAYTIAKASIFPFLGLCRRDIGSTHLERLRGLAASNRLLAFSISILLLSLLGVPPLLGFWGKLYMFKAAMAIPWLVLVALINSGFSSIYYAIAIRELLSSEGAAAEKAISMEGFEQEMLIASALITIILGLGLASTILDFSWIIR